jgi:hypothetical protein
VLLLFWGPLSDLRKRFGRKTDLTRPSPLSP